MKGINIIALFVIDLEVLLLKDVTLIRKAARPIVVIVVKRWSRNRYSLLVNTDYSCLILQSSKDKCFWNKVFLAIREELNIKIYSLKYICESDIYQNWEILLTIETSKLLVCRFLDKKH